MPKLAFVTTYALEAQITESRSIDHSFNDHFSYPLLELIALLYLSSPLPQLISFPLLPGFVK